MNLSKEQIHILRHSLGLTYSRTEYRNHYVAGATAVDDCRALVQAGCMVEHTARKISGDMPIFEVTEAGKKIAHQHTPVPRLSLGQRRWRYFQNLRDCWPDITFLDFLTKPEFEQSRERADRGEAA